MSGYRVDWPLTGVGGEARHRRVTARIAADGPGPRCGTPLNPGVARTFHCGRRAGHGGGGGWCMYADDLVSAAWRPVTRVDVAYSGARDTVRAVRLAVTGRVRPTAVTVGVHSLVGGWLIGVYRLRLWQAVAVFAAVQFPTVAWLARRVRTGEGQR